MDAFVNIVSIRSHVHAYTDRYRESKRGIPRSIDSRESKRERRRLMDRLTCIQMQGVSDDNGSPLAKAASMKAGADPNDSRDNSLTGGNHEGCAGGMDGVPRDRNPRDVLPFSARADDPLVQGKFMFHRALGQGKELSAKEVAARGGRGGMKLNDSLIELCRHAEEFYKGSDCDQSDQYRAKSYGNCAAAVSRVQVQLTLENYRRELKGRGVGNRMLEKIEEFLRSGHVRQLQALSNNPQQLAQKELMQVWGIGLSMAQKLVRLGIGSVRQLEGLTQVGEGTSAVKLTQQIQLGVAHHGDIMLKIPRAEIGEIAGEFLTEARDLAGPKVELTVCGRCV